jgi:hypothetical protein
MKTAVEWLFNQLSINNMALDKCTRAHQEMEQKILEKAKQMEKEQIIKACNDTIKSVELDSDKTGFIAQTGEGYYNKTYNK